VGNPDVDSGEPARSAAADFDYGSLAGDPEMIEACFDVYARLRIEEQVERVIARGMTWTGARVGAALGPAEEKDVFVPLATHPAGEPAALEIGRVDGGRLRRWAGEDARVVDGLGPFAEIVECRIPEPRASLIVPVRPEAGPLGLVLLFGCDAPPSGSAIARLGRLVAAVRPALQNGLRVQSMRDLVIRDDTADCFNRRYFETTLPAELSRAQRYRSALSLIFLDMDNLKEVNKRHGHAMGSRTLLEVSHRIRARIRRFDKLFRFGGDEFCIVLPETEWHGALEVAERVRDAIASRPFLTRELGDDAGVRMTASLGIASFPLHARSQADLVEHADRAMQRIKNSTKNSIGIAEIVGGSHVR
jgi:diguanylate cyclase (GGDEF)-like protein